MRRANFLPAPQAFNLNMACHIVFEAFGHPPYLVGSAVERRDYRDVDVRLVLPDDEYRRLFPDTVNQTHNAAWSLLCMSISLFLQQHTGLPVDFQIQMQSKANDEHKGPRLPMGLYLTKPEER